MENKNNDLTVDYFRDAVDIKNRSKCLPLAGGTKYK